MDLATVAALVVTIAAVAICWVRSTRSPRPARIPLVPSVIDLVALDADLRTPTDLRPCPPVVAALIGRGVCAVYGAGENVTLVLDDYTPVELTAVVGVDARLITALVGAGRRCGEGVTPTTIAGGGRRGNATVVRFEVGDVAAEVVTAAVRVPQFRPGSPGNWMR